MYASGRTEGVGNSCTNLSSAGSMDPSQNIKFPMGAWLPLELECICKDDNIPF